MNRFLNSDKSTLFRRDISKDEQHRHERQCLMEDSDSDEISLSGGIRYRQSSNRTKIFTDTEERLNTNNNQLELRDTSNAGRSSRGLPEPLEVTYYNVQPNDSLQSICLRYACSINLVKRLNGLISDQDFYGLSKIKLPLGKLGLLEEILEQTNIGLDKNCDVKPTSQSPIHRTRLVNCPGSALSINSQLNSNYKPLLSSGFSSDRISDLSSNYPRPTSSLGLHSSASSNGLQPSHSMSELIDKDVNIDMLESSYNQSKLPAEQSRTNNFIRSEMDDKVDIDDLIMTGRETMGKVFQDLDYHVEQVKMSARGYDQRAAELVNKIDNKNSAADKRTGPQPSKIPQLFYCNENFGLNYKNLLALIFVICIVVPIVYINQSSIATNRV